MLPEIAPPFLSCLEWTQLLHLGSKFRHGTLLAGVVQIQQREAEDLQLTVIRRFKPAQWMPTFSLWPQAVGVVLHMQRHSVAPHDGSICLCWNGDFRRGQPVFAATFGVCIKLKFRSETNFKTWAAVHYPPSNERM